MVLCTSNFLFGTFPKALQKVSMIKLRLSREMTTTKSSPHKIHYLMNNIVNSGFTTISHFVRASHKFVSYPFARSLRSFTGSQSFSSHRLSFILSLSSIELRLFFLQHTKTFINNSTFIRNVELQKN